MDKPTKEDVERLAEELFKVTVEQVERQRYAGDPVDKEKAARAADRARVYATVFLQGRA